MFVYLLVVVEHPDQEYFVHTTTSPLPIKGCKFRPGNGTYIQSLSREGSFKLLSRNFSIFFSNSLSLGVGKGDGTDLSLQIWLADKKIGEWTLKNPDHVKVREKERE